MSSTAEASLATKLTQVTCSLPMVGNDLKPEQGRRAAGAEGGEPTPPPLCSRHMAEKPPKGKLSSSVASFGR